MRHFLEALHLGNMLMEEPLDLTNQEEYIRLFVLGVVETISLHLLVLILVLMELPIAIMEPLKLALILLE